MSKHPPLEIEIHIFAGTDADLLVNLEDWGRQGMALVAIHDVGNLKYLYLQRIVAPGQHYPYEQQRINVGHDDTVLLSCIIRRESEAGWHLGTVYHGKDCMIQLFFSRLVPPEIEEKG